MTILPFLPQESAIFGPPDHGHMPKVGKNGATTMTTKRVTKYAVKLGKIAILLFFAPKLLGDEQNCYELNINRKIFYSLTSGFKVASQLS